MTPAHPRGRADVVDVTQPEPDPASRAGVPVSPPAEVADPFASADRPRAPLHPDARADPAGTHGAQTLLLIHDHLRAELGQVVRAVDAAVTDARRAADARALISDLSMGVNYRALGSFCGRYCSVVAMHHRIEDAVMFVDLGEADPDLQPVLDRLQVEHHVVHDALVALDAALVAMLREEASALPQVVATLQQLRAGLLSHLAYEEEELVPALRRLSVMV